MSTRLRELIPKLRNMGLDHRVYLFSTSGERAEMKQLERSRTRMRVSAKAPDWRARMGFPARLVWLMYSKLRKAPGVSTAMSFSRSSRVSRRRRPCQRDRGHLVIGWLIIY